MILRDQNRYMTEILLSAWKIVNVQRVNLACNIAFASTKPSLNVYKKTLVVAIFIVELDSVAHMT